MEGGASVINARANFLPPFPPPLNKNDVPDPGPVVWCDVLREGKGKPCRSDVPRFQAFRKIASRRFGLEKNNDSRNNRTFYESSGIFNVVTIDLPHQSPNSRSLSCSSPRKRTLTRCCAIETRLESRYNKYGFTLQMYNYQKYLLISYVNGNFVYNHFQKSDNSENGSSS